MSDIFYPGLVTFWNYMAKPQMKTPKKCCDNTTTIITL